MRDFLCGWRLTYIYIFLFFYIPRCTVGYKVTKTILRYEELGYNVVWSGESHFTFRSNTRPLSCLLAASSWFLVSLSHPPRKMRYVPQLAFTGLHDVISQKIELFTSSEHLKSNNSKRCHYLYMFLVAIASIQIVDYGLGFNLLKKWLINKIRFILLIDFVFFKVVRSDSYTRSYFIWPHFDEFLERKS
jgi:hypothetical protein